MNIRKLTRLLLVPMCVLLLADEDKCNEKSLTNTLPDEQWIFGGKLYLVQYGSGLNENQIWRIYPVSDPPGASQPPIAPFDPLFRDISDAINRTRNLRYNGGDPNLRFADALPSPVNHFTSPLGAWLRRFNPVSSTIDRTVQLTCTDTLENAISMDVAQDNSVGVVVTVGTNNRRRCANIFDPDTYSILAKVPLPQDTASNLIDVTITPDNKTAYILSYDSAAGVQTSNLYPLDLASRTLGTTIPVPQARLDSMAMTPDGSRIFFTSSSVARTLFVYDVNTGTTTSIPLNLTDPLQTIWMVMHPYGQKLYIFNSYGNRAMDVIDTSTGAVLSQTFPFTDLNKVGISPVNRGNPQFTPDGRYLFVMGGPTEVVMLDTADDSVVRRFAPPDPTKLNGNLGFFFIPD